MTSKDKKAELPPRDCEHCTFFVYDEETDSELCDYSFDEDEYSNFLAAGSDRCPYFLLYDEYKTVRKQN